MLGIFLLHNIVQRSEKLKKITNVQSSVGMNLVRFGFREVQRFEVRFLGTKKRFGFDGQECLAA